MRNLIYILCVSLLPLIVAAEDFVNGVVYVKKTSPDVNFNWVAANGKTDIQPLKQGKSYLSDKSLWELKNQSDANIELLFSSGLNVSVSPNSEFRMDSFNQVISDANVEPEVLHFTDHMLNLALMDGAAYFVAPKYSSSNSLCVLQTPLMNLELNGGSYHIKSGPKFTAIYVLEGSVGIFDNKTNRKSIKNSGTMVLIFPSPLNAGDVIITEKNIEPAELKKFQTTVNAFTPNVKQIGFVLINGKVVGVKL